MKIQHPARNKFTEPYVELRGNAVYVGFNLLKEIFFDLSQHPDKKKLAENIKSTLGFQAMRIARELMNYNYSLAEGEIGLPKLVNTNKQNLAPVRNINSGKKQIPVSK